MMKEEAINLCRTDYPMKNSNVELSVIVPCLNEAKYIRTQLMALAKQDWSEPWEVIVSDNGSTDGSQEIVEQHRDILPQIRLVDSSDCRGQAHALNVGVQAAYSEALAFCDCNDEVALGWVRAMGEALRRYDFVAGPFDTTKLNPQWLYTSRGNPQKDGINKYRYPPYLSHAGSGNMGVRRSIHEAVDGFDESMPGLFDTDYCFKIQLGGTELHFVPDALLYVRYPETFRDTYRQARHYGKYNVVLYKRYRPKGMPRLSRKTGVFGWVLLFTKLRHIHNKSSWASWIRQFGWRLGRLEASIQHRTFAL